VRRHINSVKQGAEFFHVLHQESLERKNTPKADQQAQDTRWRPLNYFSMEESETKINTCSLIEGNYLRKSGKKKMTLRSFAPVYTSILIPNPPEAKSKHLFRQLCAIHWLLEALTLGSINLMHPILTCWNPTNPGGHKKTVKEIEEEKLATYMWELFVTNTKKFTRKSRYGRLSKKIPKTSLGISQISRQSSCVQTPCGSEASSVLCSEGNSKSNMASSDVMCESAQDAGQPLFPSLQKVNQITQEKVSKDFYKQDDEVKKTGAQWYLRTKRVEYQGSRSLEKRGKGTNLLYAFSVSFFHCSSCIGSFTKSKSNLSADMRQKFIAVHEEAACSLHDTLERLERMQEKLCWKKLQALKQMKCFRRDMERMRQVGTRDEAEDEDRLNWFPELLARLPESVKSDRYVQKILKKLEAHGKNPHLKIHRDTFLKTVADLQVWELCSPEIAAAVEFVRESIVQMPEEDFSEWFQTRVATLSVESSTFQSNG
ncbi:CCD60 protein, partial [Aegotheles bennettii]|nr:CCD60 protein [Aegotheles bennettii]